MRRCALVLALAGCDSLAGTDYTGQPLITLSGTFAAGSPVPSDPLGGVALLWQDAVGAGGPGAAVTAMPVTIEFPAAFRIDVPTPPPTATRFELDGVQLAEAYVYLVQDVHAPPASTQPRGADRVHALVWAAVDVPAGSLAADYLGGAVTAGYHLRSFTTTTTPGAAQAAMIATCTSSGAGADPCQIRRAYQLGVAGNGDSLIIEVAP